MRTIRGYRGVTTSGKGRRLTRRRLLCTLLARSSDLVLGLFRGVGVRNRLFVGDVRRTVNGEPGMRKNRTCINRSLGGILVRTRSRTGRVKSRCISIRRLFLTVLGCTDHRLGRVFHRCNVDERNFLRTLSAMEKGREIASSGPRTACSALGGCNRSLIRGTESRGLSPIVKHSRRVHGIVHVLSHGAGGGPILVNRPNMNGATIMRKLTRQVIDKSIPRNLGSGAVFSLSVKTLMTKTGCHNRFRRHLGTILRRIGGDSKGVVLFVSRLRAVIKTNGASNTVSTKGVLGPVLTENRLRYVNTAALSRCHRCVRGSTTLRHHFRPILMSRPAIRSTVSVLEKLGRECRIFRKIGVASDTLITTIALSGECVSSHFLPSGTVSLISRTYTLVGARLSSVPARLSRLHHHIVRVRVRRSTLGGRRSHLDGRHLRRLRRRLTRLGTRCTDGGMR